MRAVRIAVFAALAASIVAVGPASSRPERSAARPVIVVLRAPSRPLPRSADALVRTLRVRAETSQRGVVALLRRERVPFRRFWITNAVALRADPGLVVRLRRLPDVAA